MSRRTPSRDASIALERSYLTSLRKRVATGDGSGAGGRIGRRARRLGVGTLALARVHERAVAALATSDRRTAAATARAESFFADVVAPIEEAHCGVPEALSEATRLAGLLERRTAQLAAARARLVREVARREALQAELEAGERLHADLLESSRLLGDRLRRLSHQVLTAQEEERKRISHDLHDAIGQTLTGINVGLATLQQTAATDSRELAEAISLTQKLVERSMKTVHEFARELRPTLLDDLGLVPALRSYVRTFTERTGIRVRFEAATALPRMDGDRRIALFRVAQGALSNVERHARAGRVRLTVRSLPGAVRLEVRDDGRSFDVPRTERSKTSRHLGLIVMRERVEMVGGTLSIASSQGRGTTVRAEVPCEEAAHV